MSDPMSTFEIEDVLSSIRRLVSEDLRPTHKLVTAALQNGAAKLILTPALRIVSNEAPGFLHSADDLDDPGDLQSVLDSAEAAEPDPAIEHIPMFGSVRLQEMADVQADQSTTDGEAQAAEANFLASAMSRIKVSDVSDTLTAPRPETIEKVVAAVGAAVGPEEWEVDGGEPAPHAKTWADSVWHSTDAAQTLLLLDPIQNDVKGDFSGAGDDGFGDELPVVSSETVNLPSDIEDQSMIDGAREEQDREWTRQDSIVFHHDVVAQVTPVETQQVALENTEHLDAETFVAADALDESADFLNEDMLRDIVRDMVQAELQGALGERITRNVRKLVRAEISRALASRDFD